MNAIKLLGWDLPLCRFCPWCVPRSYFTQFRQECPCPEDLDFQPRTSSSFQLVFLIPDLLGASSYARSSFHQTVVPREGLRERGRAFVLFLRFLDPGSGLPRSVLRGAALTAGRREQPREARRGRGVGRAEPGRGAERGGAGLARGARRAGASQVGRCWLSPRLPRRWPEPDARGLRAAPAVFLPRAAPTRACRRRRPRGALLENSAVPASGLPGRKPSAPR